MDAETSEAIKHPSLKLIAGAGGIVLVAGLIVYAMHKKSGGAAGASATGADPNAVGTFAPTALTINNPAPTGPTSTPPSNPTSGSGSSSGGGSKTPKPPKKHTPKTPVKRTRPTVNHPRVTHSTPATTSHPTARRTGAGGSKSTSSFQYYGGEHIPKPGIPNDTGKSGGVLGAAAGAAGNLLGKIGGTIGGALFGSWGQ